MAENNEIMEVINAINENDEFSIWEDVYVDFCKSIFKEHLPDTKIIEVYATEVYDRLFLHVDYETDYIIRMWNLTSRNIDWTLYKEVPDSDGGSHGEEICEGFYKIPSSIDEASALDDSKWERFKDIPLFEKTGCDKVILVNNASDLAFDDEFLNPDTIYFDGIDNCCTDGGLDDFTSSDIVLFKKDKSVATLEWCLEHPEFNDFMSEDEIQEWAEKEPWKKTKGTVEQIIARMTLYRNYGDEKLFSMFFKIHGEASTEKVEELFISLGSALMDWKYISVNLKDITGCNKIAFNSNKFFVQNFVKEAYGYLIVLPTSLVELQEGIFSKAFSVKCDSPEFVVKGNSITKKGQTKVITSWEPENKNSNAEDSENESSKSYDFDWKLLEDKALFNLYMGYISEARWVDDVYDFKGEELGEDDILFFDGTNSYFYMPDDYYPEIHDFDPESIICFLKNHKRTDLECCIENNTVDQIMTKSELQDWIDENPWQQRDVDIDELMSLLVLNHISRLYENHSEEDNDKPHNVKWNFSVHGEGTAEKLDSLFEMIYSYSGYDPNPCWFMKLDLTDIQGLEEINRDLAGLRIALPSTVRTIKGGALRDTFSFSCESPDFTVVNGLLLNKEKSKIISTINCGTISRIPSCVTEIDEGAFRSSKNNSSYIPGNIKKLNKESFEFSEWKDNKLVIPESIEEIPERCFFESKLEEVILPKNLKSIGKEAFSWNCLLEKVIVPENCKIEEDAFGEETEIIRLKPEDFPEIKYPKVIEFDRNKLTNIAIFDEDSTYLELVDDVNSNEFFEMDFWDKTYFDGFAENYGDGAYETSLDKIHAITKSHKRISLAEYFTNNDFILMTKEEIESWLTEKPWRKPLDIDQALALIFILKSDEFRYFTFNDKGVIEFKLSGKIAVKKMKNFLSLIKDLADSFDDCFFDEGDDYIEKIRLVLPKGCKVPEIEFDESVEIIYSDDME